MIDEHRQDSTHNVADVVLRAMTASIRHLSCVRMVLPLPYWDWYWKDVMVDTGFVMRRDPLPAFGKGVANVPRIYILDRMHCQTLEH